MKHLITALILAGAFSACTKAPEGKNCYHAATREEYDVLAKYKKEHPDDKIHVAGQDYDCVDNLPTGTDKCYQAKSADEFNKLSAEQMKNPNMAVVVDGRSYECLKAAQ